MWRNNYLINIDELVKSIAMANVWPQYIFKMAKVYTFTRVTRKHKSNTFSNIAEVLTIFHNCYIEIDFAR